jgi:hypothetical protein
MVSGAAALLREVAPGADISDIARALRAGARFVPSLLGKVRYGQLDVACSALWLSQHTHPKWRLDINVKELQQRHFTDHCFKRGLLEIQEWKFSADSFLLPAKRFNTTENLIENTFFPDPSGEKRALATQQSLLEASGRTWPKNTFAVFPIGPLPFTRPTAPPARAIYQFGERAISCPNGFRLMGVAMRWKSSHPTGYMFTAGALRSVSAIRLYIALIKPWWHSHLPAQMKVELKLQCESVPDLG